MATKTKITKNEKMQLEGLLALAKRENEILYTLKAAACQITGEEVDDFGHTSDAIWSDGTTADQLMKKMGITLKR